MKMAKASAQDLSMAMDLCNALDSLTSRWPTLPPGLCSPGDDATRDRFDCDDDQQCGTVVRHLLEIANRGSLMRVVWGCAVMLDPRNRCVDPDADVIEHHPAAKAGLDAQEARPSSEWHEDIGSVLWWKFPVDEPPYCGTPLDAGWHAYHTHWTPLIVPTKKAPSDGAMREAQQ